jgi:PDZ domain-containing protein
MATMVPVTAARVLAATTAQIRRQSGVPRYGALGVVCTSTGGRAPVRRPRATGTVALAGLRHPVAMSATMARAAIQAEAVVSSVSDTQEEMVPGSASSGHARSPESGSRLHLLWAVPLAVVAMAIITTVLLAALVPGSWRAENRKQVEAPYALVPSSAEPVAPRLSFDAVERYRADGRLLFVTVRLPAVSLLDWWVGEDRPEVTFYSYEDKYGTQTPTQQQQVNLQLMRTAKETAEYVALSHLGYPATLVPGDVIIDELVCLQFADDGSCAERAPSDEVLDPGDTLVKADGEPLATVDDLGPILKRHKPGDRITVEFKRPGKGEQEGEIELIADPDDPNRTIIGFVPFDTARAELPFEVDIATSEIGGPSAGLAFTLTLIDELTPGELTGGTSVAVTGTIRTDGSVGPIGGLAQKASAAKQMGAKVFIVPTEQGPDDLAKARAVAGDDLVVIDVADLDEALSALASYGGNGLELGKPGADYTPLN